MDFISTVLGLQLPTLKARDCVRREPRCSLVLNDDEHKIVWGCEWDLSPSKCLDSDDETASTLSESDDSSSAESLAPCVTFATPLVTDVFTRPATERQDKELLYYSDYDYRQFRIDFRNSLLRRRTPSVTFATGLVTQVHELPFVENKHEIYYSSAELKNFLEAFILSLDQKTNS